MTNVLVRERREVTEGGRGRDESDAATSIGTPEPPEAERGQEGFFPRAFRSVALLTH